MAAKFQVGVKVKTIDMSVAEAGKSTATVISYNPSITRFYGGVLKTFDEYLVQFDGGLQQRWNIDGGLSQ